MLFENDALYEEDEYFTPNSTREDDPPELQMLYKVLEDYASSERIRILNPRRMQQMLLAKAALERLLAENEEEASVRILDDDFLPGACALSAEADLLILHVPERFADLTFADNIEIVPLLKGRIQINLMFYGVYRVEPLRE